MQGKAKCAHLEGPQLPRPFRTLSDYLPAIASHLERRINAMEGLLARDGHDLSAVNTGSETDVVVAGRICHNAEATSTSIATLEIEGSRALSSGARVKLDCSLLPSFSFFPGQVVGIVGRNPTGSCLTPHKVIDTMPVPAATPLPEIPAAAQHQCARVVIASGPFVPGGELELTGLHAVLSYCRQHPPDALILCGPFIPDTHPELLNLRTSFQDVFAQQVRFRTSDEHHTAKLFTSRRLRLDPKILNSCIFKKRYCGDHCITPWWPAGVCLLGEKSNNVAHLHDASR